MNVIKYPQKEEWDELLKRPVMNVDTLRETVCRVLDDVKTGGDRAVMAYEKQFDHVELERLAVTEEEMDEAERLVSPELKDALRLAHDNIGKFHASQRFETTKVEVRPGVTCWQKAVPIERVGLYIPGGTAPLFSTVLMLATPAKIAGCREIVLCTPPGRDGKVHPAILCAARVAGVNRIFKAGGVQAIGAMAYGTESVPKVYKIFGPGNQYVMAAKQQVSLHDVAIDMPAGPSEVEVLADFQSGIRGGRLAFAGRAWRGQPGLVGDDRRSFGRQGTGRSGTPVGCPSAQGNRGAGIGPQQTCRGARHGRGVGTDQPLRARTSDYRNGRLHAGRRTCGQCRQRVPRFLYAGECGGLCFGYEPYVAYQWLCHGL